MTLNYFKRRVSSWHERERGLFSELLKEVSYGRKTRGTLSGRGVVFSKVMGDSVSLSHSHEHTAAPVILVGRQRVLVA